MEEKKTPALKVVKGEEKQQQKLSYEQLNEVAHQLSDQSAKLYQKLMEANQFNLFKRLEFLFKVVELKDNFDVNFVAKCTTEIEQLITLPEEADKEETKE